MKMATKRKRKSPAPFEEEDRSAFGEYAGNGGEAALGRAYELGRRAITEKKSLMEIASLHHRALHEMLAEAPGTGREQELLAAAGAFLGELLSPFEMAHRGVQDAIVALRQLNETLEEEIKRIAYSFHDEAGQLLVAVHLALADVAREAPNSRRTIENITDLLKKVEVQLRQFSHELRPTVLDDLGLIPAIRFLAGAVSKRSNLPIRVSAEIPERLASSAEIAVYRVVQEALTNAVKHSQARSVSVEIFSRDATLHCIIQDDGVGFSPESA